MKALVYHGPEKKDRESKEDPGIERPTGAVVRIEATTICGTDLHILKGEVSAVLDGRTLGHEAVGVPATFELCTELVRPGGHVANIGVHGAPATLHLEKLWIKNVTITTGLGDTYSTPTLLRLVSEGKLDPTPFATHPVGLGEILDAYDTFADAAHTDALKVVLSSQR